MQEKKHNSNTIKLPKHVAEIVFADGSDVPRLRTETGRHAFQYPKDLDYRAAGQLLATPFTRAEW